MWLGIRGRSRGENLPVDLELPSQLADQVGIIQTHRMPSGGSRSNKVRHCRRNLIVEPSGTTLPISRMAACWWRTHSCGIALLRAVPAILPTRSPGLKARRQKCRRGTQECAMPLSLPNVGHLHNSWGGPPGPRGSPGPALLSKNQAAAIVSRPTGGVGRGPGGPPHNLCRIQLGRKLSDIAQLRGYSCAPLAASASHLPL